MTLPSPSKFKKKSGKKLSLLCTLLDVSVDELREWKTGIPEPYGYITFTIPKRSGFRCRIDAPNEPLKNLQRAIYKKMLKHESVPTGVTGFVIERSIFDNAIPHVEAKVVIKIDLKNFFHSIESSKIYNYWISCHWNEECAEILTNICCFNDSLPQGAPTSPALSNVINRSLDSQVVEIAHDYQATYTRYADDITLSIPRKIQSEKRRIKPLIQKIIEQFETHGYKIQYRKGIKVLRSHQQQIITGLVVNERVRLPRATRKKIRGMKHKRDLGLLSELDEKRLVGYEQLQYMVEKSWELSQRRANYRKENNPQVAIERIGNSSEEIRPKEIPHTTIFVINSSLALGALIGAIGAFIGLNSYGIVLVTLGSIIVISGIVINYWAAYSADDPHPRIFDSKNS